MNLPNENEAEIPVSRVEVRKSHKKKRAPNKLDIETKSQVPTKRVRIAPEPGKPKEVPLKISRLRSQFNLRSKIKPVEIISQQQQQQRGRKKKQPKIDPTKILQVRLEKLEESFITNMTTKGKENIPAAAMHGGNSSESEQNQPTPDSSCPVKIRVPSEPKPRKGRKRLNTQIATMQLINVAKDRPLSSVIRTTTESREPAEKVKKNYQKRMLCGSVGPARVPTGESGVNDAAAASAEPAGLETSCSNDPAMIDAAEWKHSDFVRITKISEGGYAHICTAFSLSRNRTYVLKYSTRKPRLGPGDVIIEHDLQKKAVHDHIVKHLGVYMMKKRHVFIMDYFDQGDLHDFIYQEKYKHLLVEPKQKQFIRQIVSAAYYIQSKLGYIHKDLKPENVLVANPDCLKVTDFGCATPIKSLRYLHRTGGETAGTVQYSPSEEMEDQVFDSTADVWAIGIISYEIFVQGKPFMTDIHDDVEQMLPRIKAFENRTMQSRDFGKFERENQRAYDFVQRLLAQRLRRPVLSAVGKIEWLKE